MWLLLAWVVSLQSLHLKVAGSSGGYVLSSFNVARGDLLAYSSVLPSCAFVLSRGLAGLRSTVSCRRNQGGSDNGSLLFGGQAAGVTDFTWV